MSLGSSYDKLCMNNKGLDYFSFALKSNFLGLLATLNNFFCLLLSIG